MIRESLRMSLDNISHNKITSTLTILGIVIGITAIVSLLSIGQGLQNAIADQLEQFGSDKVMVMSGMAGGMPGSALMGEALEDRDVDMIKKISGVESAVGMLIKTLPIEYNKKIITTYVSGLSSKESEKFFSDIQSFEFDKGRFFKSGEKKVAVIGSKLVHDAFDRNVDIGTKIKIKSVDYEVIGILKSTGSSQDDQSVMIPLDSLRDLTDSRNDLTMVFAKVSDVSRVDSIAKNIEKKLDDKYGKDAYMAMTSGQIIDRVAGIFAAVSLVIGGIAFISLIVAGVGITNTMFMSVMERTREIGIMKAIGATNYDVMEIFLVESALLGFVGGAIGCLVGALISFAVSAIGVNLTLMTIKATPEPSLILLALGFAIVVGLLSGLWPARRAARLNPIDALRYE